MTAGMNNRFRIIRTNFADDDYVGGAVVTGTVVYNSVMGRFQQQPVDQVFLAQGLEVNKTFTAVVIPGTLDIRERDELEVIDPKDHWAYLKRFRIVSARPSDHNPRDPRNYMMLQLTRSVQAHGNQ